MTASRMPEALAIRGLRRRSVRTPTGPLAFSIGVHLVLGVVLSQITIHRPVAEELHWQELGAAGTTPAADPSAPASGRAQVQAGGAQTLDNVLTALPGGGGDRSGVSRFALLVERSHTVRLQDSVQTARASQIQRIRTSRERSSAENRRSTPNPNEQPFLASGDGSVRERRVLTARMPREGAERAPDSSEQGAVPRPDFEAGEGAARAPSAESGRDLASPGRGVLRAHGQVESARAPSATGRPDVDEGPAATLANVADRPRDNVNSEQLAEEMRESVVEASPRAGAGENAFGLGGPRDTRRAGSGNSNSDGGRARANRPGSGGYDALDTSDRRYRHWYQNGRRAISRRLVFPRERALALDQGLCVYRLWVRRDGTLAREPRRVRSTGFADFDQNALQAILRAAPFEPIPSDLVPDQNVLRIDMTVEFANPLM